MSAMNRFWDKRRQYLLYAALSAAAFGLTAAVVPSSSAYFRRFFGNINPLVVVAAAGAIGGLSLAQLETRGWPGVFKGTTSLRGMALSAGLATLFSVVIVIVDVFIRYPENLNVPVPEAVAFYPAVGFVAEVAFHLLPLTLITLALTPVSKGPSSNSFAWLCIALTAAVKPTFQMSFERELLSWAAAYTWVHVFLIGFFQLYVFRRYDFVTMYCFRLFYYAYWHLIWGVVRLEVLF
jgi:hypothetical protein